VDINRILTKCVKQPGTFNDNQVSILGGQIHLHTIIRENIFTGQKFAAFDFDLSFSNLPTSISQRMGKSWELMTMKSRSVDLYKSACAPALEIAKKQHNIGTEITVSR
jgi:hypothetical protein